MKHLTGNQAAALIGVSRKTLYRWHAQGRLFLWEWTEAQIEARWAELTPRKRGPKRDPRSKRYHEGRHSFDRGLK
jgi:hypothetical protein